MSKSDFERVGDAPQNPNPFDSAPGANEEKHDYITEGRKSYIRIKNKKNWPPTMDDLLEYISIYSQMNNIKFTTLNNDKYFQRKDSKKKQKGGKNGATDKGHK